MQLKEYFEETEGVGVMSTADREGRVDAAIYARPHVMDDGSLAFIMRERLTHRNIGENPYASYLFIEKGAGYRGIRLYLKKIREDNDVELIATMTRRCLTPEEDAARGPKFMVYFSIEKALKLIGGDSVDLDG
ncbi:MAG: pyridoxamine 5'-phosphate oxidase family protein [Desulfuromonadales bacterium]|nr:pyridoxamine 5'-phosphate oxidase family protein [Desulfuromonadales bacterium]